MGLSQRELTDEEIGRLPGSIDFAAVAARLGAPRVSVFGTGPSGPSAAALAADRPDLVEHLILWSPVQDKDFQSNPAVRAALALVREDWVVFTETWAHAFHGWTTGSRRAHQWAQFIQRSTSPENSIRVLENVLAYDYSPILPAIEAKTLVLSGTRLTSLGTAQFIAAGVEDARLVLLEIDDGATIYDSEAGTRAMLDFIDEPVDTPSVELTPPPSVQAATPAPQPTSDQEIKYVRTPDGVNIAYTDVGEGTPFVKLQAWPFCHLEAEWTVPTGRLMDERAAEMFRLVRLDFRGSGLSQRDVEDISLDARVMDLETVVDHLGLEPAIIFASGTAGPVAIAYAVRHPNRVLRLVLTEHEDPTRKHARSEQARGLSALRHSDWNLFTETLASVIFGWTEGEPARKFAAYLRECVTPEEGRSALAAAAADDVTSMLGDVKAPTVVSRGTQSVFAGQDAAGALVAAIPNATLMSFSGGSFPTSAESIDQAYAQLAGFLGLEPKASAGAQTAGSDTSTAQDPEPPAPPPPAPPAAIRRDQPSRRDASSGQVMELKIQYAKRADGAKTALATMGSGPYLVVPPGWISHLELMQGDPAGHAFMERLAKQNTLVLYDKHGCGLSDRDRTDFTIEDDLLDLDAVVEELALEKFALFGNSSGGSISLLYASRHPEKVTRLALYGTGAGFAPGEHPRYEATTAALASLIRANWGLGSKALADVFYPSGVDQETLERHARFEKMAATGEMTATLLERTEFRTDLRPLLPDITSPALVIHRRGDQVVAFAAGQELAKLLPNARFVPLEGDIHIPGDGDSESVLGPLLEFLTEGEDAGLAAAPQAAEPPAPPPAAASTPQPARREASRGQAMEPQIQYVTTKDGVNIAYYAIGEGPATLYLIMPQSHLEVEWKIDAFRIGFTAAAQQNTWVRLDPRGCGLSDRDPDDFSIDSLVLDIEAVVDRLGLDSLRIYAIAFATMPALAYTARHPDKVTHLVLQPPVTSGNDMSNERIDKLFELAKVDWGACVGDIRANSYA